VITPLILAYMAAGSLFDAPDWKTMFAFDTPLLEIFIRGSMIYLGVFLLLRLVLKRESGTVGMTDLLVIVLIADAAQNGMAGEYHSITDGLLLVATILFWSFSLDWLAYHTAFFARLVHPPPIMLVRDGKVNRRNLRRELITMEEFQSVLREHGVNDVADVKEARMEGDGQISVVKKEESDAEEAPKKRVP
jgi:uncharacterized membrane protein YcaP (DUF421 family)